MLLSRNLHDHYANEKEPGTRGLLLGAPIPLAWQSTAIDRQQWPDEACDEEVGPGAEAQCPCPHLLDAPVRQGPRFRLLFPPALGFLGEKCRLWRAFTKLVALWKIIANSQ